jgi:anaerobic selenocysteine-containing dehydrogenase
MKAMDRRQFLATGATGAVALAAGTNAVANEAAWNSRSTRSLRKFREPAPTACPGCASHCAMIAYRYQGKVMGLTPVNGGCARGLAMLESLYDAERLTLPLRRVGERGSGQWETIGWGEAIAQINEALKANDRQHVVDLGRPDPVAGELLPKLGFDRIVTEGASRNWAARQAQQTLYEDALARPDVRGAKTILLLGAHPLDQGDDLAALTRELVSARKRGAKILSISPYQGLTGSFADRWIPTRPGGEATVALALIRVLLAGAQEPAAQDIFQRLAPFDVAACADAGVDEETLAFLADRIRTNRMVCITDTSGRGDGLPLETAAALLNLLSGAVAAGAVQKEYLPDWFPALVATDPRERIVAELAGSGPGVGVYLDYRANPVYRSPESDKAKAAFAAADRVGLLVTMDTLLTETALVADLVLPAAADLECWNLLAGGGQVRVQQPVNVWRSETSYLRDEKVVPEWLFDGPPPSPLGEAKQLGELLLELAPGASGDLRSYLGALLQTRAPQALAEIESTGVHLLRNDDILGSINLDAGLSGAAPLSSEPGEALSLTVLRRVELDAAYANSLWGRELAHANPLMINAQTAKRLGVSKGDFVTVTTPAGEARVPVLPIQGIHPEAAVIHDDFGHWGGGATARASSIPLPLSDIKMTRRNWAKQALLAGRSQPGFAPWWIDHGPGVSARAFTPLQLDATGAQVWSGLQVTLRPA